MKYLIILADGFADHLIPELGDKTPMMAAQTPHIDALCKLSNTGLFHTVPANFHPGSEVANLAVLGYDLNEVYQGRGVLEAASMGVAIEPEDLVFRCNLITIEDEIIINHSAGHITTEEASQIIETLNKELGSDVVKFYPGVSYRHLIIIKGGKGNLNCTPPHDVPGTNFNKVLPNSNDTIGEETAKLIQDLILKSEKILENHPVNVARREKGKKIASHIWPWSPGYKPKMKTLQELYGIKSGAVISAVDLIFGIGVLAGLKPIYVDGATGLYDTNYEGKAQATLDALKENDFVYLHIEASDEAGHEGDFILKTKTLEDLDQRVVKTIVEGVKNIQEPVAIAILPDHPTPCKLRTHTREAIPFMIYKPGVQGDNVTEYNEVSVKNGSFGEIEGNQFMKLLLS